MNGSPHRGPAPAGPLFHPRRLVSAAATLASLIALAGAVGGCVVENDLISQYGLGESQRALLMTFPDFQKTPIQTLPEKPPPAATFEEDRLGALLEGFVGPETLDQPPDAKPAFAIVFFPEEPHAFKAVLLDQYLNLWPGFHYLGETYIGVYAEPVSAWKRFVLRALETLPGGMDHLKKRLQETAKTAPSGEED